MMRRCGTATSPRITRLVLNHRPKLKVSVKTKQPTLQEIMLKMIADSSFRSVVDTTGSRRVEFAWRAS